MHWTGILARALMVAGVGSLWFVEGCACCGVGDDVTVTQGLPQTSSTLECSVTQDEILPAFREFAEAMGTVPVFGLRVMPQGMEVASGWWPVIEQAGVDEAREALANPHIEGSASSEPEGQLLLRCNGGWLDIVADFRGDLGDVAGESVGTVVGRPAALYQVNGGWLVQWSYEGRWYGLFGRGVPRDVVTSTALSMMLIERY
jgi:hypothetical protein